MQKDIKAFNDRKGNIYHQQEHLSNIIPPIPSLSIPQILDVPLSYTNPSPGIPTQTPLNQTITMKFSALVFLAALIASVSVSPPSHSQAESRLLTHTHPPGRLRWRLLLQLRRFLHQQGLYPQRLQYSGKSLRGKENDGGTRANWRDTQVRRSGLLQDLYWTGNFLWFSIDVGSTLWRKIGCGKIVVW